MSRYIVNLFIDSSHEYDVIADSPEEAVEIAEDRYETEDEGKLVWYEVTETVAHLDGDDEEDDRSYARNTSKTPSLSEYDGDEDFD